MDVYTYRDITERINAAEEKFPGNGPTVALLEAILEQNEMIRATDDYIPKMIEIAVEDIVDV